MTATGRLTAKPKKTSAGVLTIVLERDGAAPVKVMADPSSRVAARVAQGRRDVPGHRASSASGRRARALSTATGSGSATPPTWSRRRPDRRHRATPRGGQAPTDPGQRVAGDHVDRPRAHGSPTATWPSTRS